MKLIWRITRLERYWENGSRMGGVCSPSKHGMYKTYGKKFNGWGMPPSCSHGSSQNLADAVVATMLATMDFLLHSKASPLPLSCPTWRAKNGLTPGAPPLGAHHTTSSQAGAGAWLAGRASASNKLETLSAQKGGAVCPLNVCMLIIGVSWLRFVETSEASAPHGPCCCTTLLVCLAFGLSLHRVGQ